MKHLTNSGAITDADSRYAQLTALIEQQLHALLTEHLQPAEQAVADSAEDSDKPPLAKLSITVSWPAGGSRGSISCKVSYGKPRKDEIDTPFDLETQPLELPEPQ